MPSCTSDDIDTPALCLDLEIFERNIRQMVGICATHGVHWRPHAKCHKSPWIGNKLVEAGALGVTCATLREAETMALAGIEDILIAHMIAGRPKLARLVGLSKRCRPIVCVDHADQATTISDALESAGKSIRVLIELDIGMQRVGIGELPAMMRLAQQVDQLPGLELAGVMAYEGHLLTIPDWSDKELAIRNALQTAVDGRDLLLKHGLPCPIVSCGGTGSYPIAVSQVGITEIQAGGAIFMDAFYRDACQMTQLEHALTVRSTIVSLPSPGRAVMDAGLKALDTRVAQPTIVGHPGVSIDWLSAEHGVLSIAEGADQLRLGDTIQILPGYADLTNKLHSQFYGLRRGQLERIIPIHH